MKLGKKMSEMYDHPTSKDALIHPSVHLPAEMFNKSYKVGDTCNLTLSGTIESMSKSGYSVKLTDGAEGEPDSDDKKTSKAKSSLIKDAKTDT